MAREIKCEVGRGSFFINTFKDADNKPDYKGSINICGTPEDLAVWCRTDKDGVMFMRCICGTTKAMFRLDAIEQKSRKAPAYRGFVEYSGKKWEVAGWIQMTKTNKPYCSLSIKEPQENQGEAKPATAPIGFPVYGNNDIYGNAQYPTTAPQEVPQDVQEAIESSDALPF